MYKFFPVLLIIGVFYLSPAWGDDATPSDQQPVTRQELEQIKKDDAQLKTDNADMKKELAELKKQQADQATSSQQDANDFDKQMDALRDAIHQNQPGAEGVVIAGDANFGFETQRMTPSTFFADMSPLILWQPPDSHLLVETAFDLGIGGADINSEATTVTLNLADISYTVCDNCTVGAGLFAVPFGQFHNHFDPPWIDKFADDPLAFDAIAPISEVGAFLKGAVPSGTTYWTYDLYATNGPNLITNDPNLSGQLNFNDYTDLNNNKAVGGRIGFLPFPDVETGYSLQYSKPNPAGFPTTTAFLQAVDLHWKPTVKSLYGQFDFAGEWIWSDLSTATYDPTGALGFGPETFNNFRQGGYVSLCYRPTEVDNKILRNLEFCARYDNLQGAFNTTGLPGGVVRGNESRWTLGVDYWVTPMCVVKADYEMDSNNAGPDLNAFIFQVGIGL